MSTPAEQNLAQLRAQWHSARPERRPAIEAMAENVKKAVARAQEWAAIDEKVRSQREDDQKSAAAARSAAWPVERIRAVMAEVRT